MRQASPEKDRFIRVYAATCALLAGLLGLRLAYIAASGSPLSEAHQVLPLGALLLAIGSYFVFVRFRPILAALFAGIGLAAIASFQAQNASALVLRSGRHLPLADDFLAAADHFIGFDWPTALTLFNQYPALDPFWQASYNLFLVQPVILIVALALTRQPERMFRLVAGTTVALSITQVVAMHFPALGPYEFFKTSFGDHLDISPITAAKMTAGIQWLRAATLVAPSPVITVGLISFPSFHAACAVIFAWALWRTPGAKWIGLGMNTLMLIATPVHGSHYMVDVLAGIVVGAASLGITGVLLKELDVRWEQARATWRIIPDACRQLLRGGSRVPPTPIAPASNFCRQHCDIQFEDRRRRDRGTDGFIAPALCPMFDGIAPRRQEGDAKRLIEA